MNYIGIDLHKKTITVCVMNQERKILKQRTFACVEAETIRQFFEEWRPWVAVIEATASYEWLWQLLEPLGQKQVLAHPKKLRVIAESKTKSDRVDARVLAEFLALEMIPPAYRPTPRQRQHRALVRQRVFLKRCQTRMQNKIRRVLSDYNADRRDLFSAEGLKYLATLSRERLSAADQVVIRQLLASWQHYQEQVKEIRKRLKEFGQKAPLAEREARAALGSAPGVGEVTVEVLLSEIGDLGRFRSAKKVAAYAGLAPGQRESAGRKKELPITKEGSKLLRWVMVQAAWRLVRYTKRWQRVFDQLRQRRGRKKAIVAVARRYLAVLVALWRKGERYRFAS